MAYFIDLFSPDNYATFTKSDRTISGFRLRQRGVASRIKQGDCLVGYITGLSRWCGLLDVVEGPFLNSTPVFSAEADPFVVRFRVQARIWLPPESSPPIHDESIWKRLSFTRSLPKGSREWIGKIRSSLVRLDDKDGAFLDATLTKLAKSPVEFQLHDLDRKTLTRHTVNRIDKTVVVSVPGDGESRKDSEEGKTRESTQIQTVIAQIGAKMGMSIWIPMGDRSAVLKEWKGEKSKMLERLPLNYDDTTLRTIEQIDVLWLRGRSIVRAFEVEHTTSVFSGILRMADLLALQPNMQIKLHIVAPIERREKVFSQIRRPVFSLLDKGPLAESCTYLSYDSVRQLATQKHLAHLSDTVLDEYIEEAE